MRDQPVPAPTAPDRIHARAELPARHDRRRHDLRTDANPDAGPNRHAGPNRNTNAGSNADPNSDANAPSDAATTPTATNADGNLRPRPSRNMLPANRGADS